MACCTNRSVTVGTHRFLTPPSGFGISTLRRTTCRYAALRLSLLSICSIRLLVSMRSFLSVSLETSTLKVHAFSLHLSATFTPTSGNFRTLSSFADLSVFQSLICDSCSSDQRFAYSFLPIPPHDGHPCCSAIHFLVA